VDTLIFLMGVGNLPRIVGQLLAHGRPPETPAATVRWGTMPVQATVTGTLADIADRVRAAGLKPPAVTVVGQVAALRETLRWFEERPLFGQRILVTRTRDQASVLSTRLRALGAEAVELPTIRIAPPDDWEPLDRAIASLSDYDWIVFTSVNGVRFFWERLGHANLDARALHGVRLAAIGPATAGELEARGISPDHVPPTYVAEAIVDGRGDVRGKRILLPRADIARPALAEHLRRGGAQVTEVTAYHTVQPEMDTRGLSDVLSGVTAATFTSSSTVRNLAAMAKQADLDLRQILDGKTIVCIGPITAGTARELGLSVHIIACEYTIDGLAEALIRHFSGKDIPEK
jgi:uroporphyrinogen III methyltransferase/synthase